MKANAILRIVLYSLLILVLLGLLIAGLSGAGIFSPVVSLGGSGYDGPISEARSGSVPASGIQKLDLSWASGSITVVPGDTDEISFFVPEDADPLAWYVSEGTLSVRYQKNLRIFGFRPIRTEKDVSITVPKEWIAEEISIDAASTELTVRDLTFSELEIDGASNHTVLTDCHVGEISLDGAANRLVFQGVLGKLASDGASNDCTLTLAENPREISMDGVSSKLVLTAPEDFGFTVDADGLSFELDTDFEITGNGKNHVTAGDGSCRISVDGVSASLQIRKAG